MDEILATIRRIIAEDEQPGGPSASGKTGGVAAAAGRPDHASAAQDTAGKTAEDTPRVTVEPGATVEDDKDDIIELTEALNEDGTVRHLVPMGGTSRIAALRVAPPVAPTAEPEQAPPPAAPSSEPERMPPLTTFAAAPERGPDPAPPEAAAPEQPGNRDEAHKIDERLVSDAAATTGVAPVLSASSQPSPEREPQLGATGRTLEDMVRDLVRPMLQAWLDAHLPAIVERLVQAEIARGGRPGAD